MPRKTALVGAVLALPLVVIVAALILLRSEPADRVLPRASGHRERPGPVDGAERPARTVSHGLSTRADSLDRDRGETSPRVAALVRAACSRNTSARDEAIAALVDMGDGAVPHLARMLAEQRPPQQLKTIAQILVRIGTPAALAVVEDALDAGEQENRRAIVASGVVDAASAGADGTVRDVMRSDPQLAWRVRAGRRWGQAAREGSVGDWVDGYYRAESDLERRQYLDAVRAGRNPESIPELEHVVRQNPDEEVVGAAALSLARIGTDRTVSVLVDELRRFAGSDRAQVLSDALGNVRNRELLEAHRDDENETVRKVISDILEESDDQDDAETDSDQNDDPDKDDDDTDDDTGREGGAGPAISPFD